MQGKGFKNAWGGVGEGVRGQGITCIKRSPFLAKKGPKKVTKLK